MKDEVNFIGYMVTAIFILVALLGYVTLKKIDYTKKEWKQIVVKQAENINKHDDQNKTQDVIINKLNAEYNLKCKKKLVMVDGTDPVHGWMKQVKEMIFQEYSLV